MQRSLLKLARVPQRGRHIVGTLVILLTLLADVVSAAPGDALFPNDASAYEGERVDGVPEGKGVQRWSDGRRYAGDFRSGQRTGLGVLTLNNGTRFQGQFLNDRMEGFLLRENPDGMREIQEWRAGELINAWPLREVPDCRLALDNVLWMFVGSRCTNGFAHGSGFAARLDGRAVIPDGLFVIGRLVSGHRVPLVDARE